MGGSSKSSSSSSSTVRSAQVALEDIPGVVFAGDYTAPNQGNTGVIIEAPGKYANVDLNYTDYGAIEQAGLAVGQVLASQNSIATQALDSGQFVSNAAFNAAAESEARSLDFAADTQRSAYEYSAGIAQGSVEAVQRSQSEAYDFVTSISEMLNAQSADAVQRVSEQSAASIDAVERATRSESDVLLNKVVWIAGIAAAGLVAYRLVS